MDWLFMFMSYLQYLLNIDFVFRSPISIYRSFESNLSIMQTIAIAMLCCKSICFILTKIESNQWFDSSTKQLKSYQHYSIYLSKINSFNAHNLCMRVYERELFDNRKVHRYDFKQQSIELKCIFVVCSSWSLYQGRQTTKPANSTLCIVCVFDKPNVFFSFLLSFPSS